MDHRQLVRSLAAGRIAVGAALTIAPGFAGRSWIGPTASQPEVKVMTRAMGVRDLALGAGTLHAIESGEPAKTWVLLGAASDAVDFAATVIAIRRLGLRRALPVMVVAATAATFGFLASDHLE